MRIAVSACLLGSPCRYDGKSVPVQRVVDLGEGNDLIPICPECLGGLDTPRPRAEIVCGAQDASAQKVVRTQQGRDVSNAYLLGAHKALDIYRAEGCTCAILKSRSPSCGIREVHDGRFGEGMVVGQGVTAALFQEVGITVYDETDIESGIGIDG